MCCTFNGYPPREEEHRCIFFPVAHLLGLLLISAPQWRTAPKPRRVSCKYCASAGNSWRADTKAELEEQEVYKGNSCEREMGGSKNWHGKPQTTGQSETVVARPTGNPLAEPASRGESFAGQEWPGSSVPVVLLLAGASWESVASG